MPVLQHWDDLPEQQAPGAARRRRFEGFGIDLVQVQIQAGTKAQRHSHPHEQVVQVLAGRGTLETENGRQPFSAGSLFHFPAGTWHAAVFDEDTTLVETNIRAS